MFYIHTRIKHGKTLSEKIWPTNQINFMKKNSINKVCSIFIIELIYIYICKEADNKIINGLFSI